MVPLGAKAKVNLQHNDLAQIPHGSYKVRITDISGAYWDHHIVKSKS